MADEIEIHLCIDRPISQVRELDASARAIRENPENRPPAEILDRVPSSQRERFGAVLTGKRWKPGRTLRVRHMNGDAAITAKVEHYVKEWERHANIVFSFIGAGDADIRVRYDVDNRSWSRIGTDALVIPGHEETMHFGWLKPGTPEAEFSRVILHEFGHALGMIHEHSQPNANIQWDKPVVYRYYDQHFGWTKEDVDFNWFAKYSAEGTQFTAYDRASIMHYFIPKQFTIDQQEIPHNTTLSAMDRTFIATVYPKP